MLGFVAFGIFEFLDEALTPPMKNVPVLKIHFKFEFVWLHAIAHSLIVAFVMHWIFLIVGRGQRRWTVIAAPMSFTDSNSTRFDLQTMKNRWENGCRPRESRRRWLANVASCCSVRLEWYSTSQ
jgi:hypothetical protein